jgi:phosphate butyryltransferase
MSLRTFADVAKLVKAAPKAKTAVLVWAADEHSLEAAFSVERDGLLRFLFTGVREDIKKIGERLGYAVPDSQIYNAKTPDEAAIKSIALIKSGAAQFLMKGKLETAELLRHVVNKEHGLAGNGVMSHIALNEIPAYHKLLITTDGGMLLYPTVEQKKSIIENAVSVMNALGEKNPKVCVLAAVEKVNPKMPETIDAAALKDMNKTGVIANCVVEGPISLDLAMVRERSIAKGYESPCAGEADILVAPNIHAGNLLGKSFVEMANTKMAGLIVGAACPIVLTSRGSSSEEKYNSLVLACAVSKL